MRAAPPRQCPADLPLLILPVQAVGKSNEHLWAAGTLTLTAATALAAWAEIGRSVARAGVRRLVLMNSHGGNLAVNEILSRELRVDPGMRVVRAGWGHFGTPPGMYSDRELRFGIHGGDVETSLMLHFAPGTVDMSAARDFVSSAETTAIPPTGPVGYGWISTDLNEAGVVGEAHLATAEKGRATAAGGEGGGVVAGGVRGGFPGLSPGGMLNHEPEEPLGLCCTNPFSDSSRESSVVAGLHEQTHTAGLQDQELAGL